MRSGYVGLGLVRLEMFMLGFSLVWLGLIWFGSFPCLKKWRGINRLGKTVGERPIGEKFKRGKELAGKRPAGKRSGGEKMEGKRPAGKRPSTTFEVLICNALSCITSYMKVMSSGVLLHISSTTALSSYKDVGFSFLLSASRMLRARNSMYFAHEKINQL